MRETPSKVHMNDMVTIGTKILINKIGSTTIQQYANKKGGRNRLYLLHKS